MKKYSALLLVFAFSALAGCTSRFVDDFDDGVVSPRYTALGGASLVEFGGKLVVTVGAAEDGVAIDVSDVVPKAVCYKLGYEISGIDANESMVIETYYEDLSTGNEFLAFSFVTTQSTVKVTATAYDKDGNVVGERTFDIESCDHAGAFSYQLDFVDGKWVIDWRRNINPEDCALTSLNIEWVQNSLEGLKATKLVVKSKSAFIVSLDTFEISDTHTEPPAIETRVKPKEREAEKGAS